MLPRVLPGDLVAFRDHGPEAATAQLVNEPKLPAPASTPFVTASEALLLQKARRVQSLIGSRAVFLVICASQQRALVFHPHGHLLVAEAKFLRRL